MNTIFVGLAKSDNMIKNLRVMRFSQDELITKDEFEIMVEKAMDETEESVINCAGHDGCGLVQNRITVQMGMGDRIVWAQHIGARRDEDGTGEADEWLYLTAIVENRPGLCPYRNCKCESCAQCTWEHQHEDDLYPYIIAGDL